MNKKLAVIALGRRNSGKTTTWNTMFQTTVRTGTRERPLYLNKAQLVDVFLVSGSPEERDTPVAELLPSEPPTIVLCSAQYHPDVRVTFEYFFRHGYDVHVQWLNPGHPDDEAYVDDLALCHWLLRKGATVQQRDGRTDPPYTRVDELRQVIVGWATMRGLLRTEWLE